jgi:hypothetical protein
MWVNSTEFSNLRTPREKKRVLLMPVRRKSLSMLDGAVILRSQLF